MKITSKFPGTCRDCGARISRGQLVEFHGRGRGVSCVSCEPKANAPLQPDAPCWELINAEKPEDEDDAAGFERGTLASDRRLARNGLTVVRTSSGWSGTRNSRGRCEDAPCCGCCTF